MQHGQHYSKRKYPPPPPVKRREEGNNNNATCSISFLSIVLLIVI